MARKAKNTSSFNHRFALAVAFLVLIAVGISLLNVNASPTAAAVKFSSTTGQEPNEYLERAGIVDEARAAEVTVSGLAGTSVFSPNDNGVEQYIAFKFSPSYVCINNEGASIAPKLTITKSGIKYPEVSFVYSKDVTVNFQSGGLQTYYESLYTEIDRQISPSWPDGKYDWKLECPFTIGSRWHELTYKSPVVSGTFTIDKNAYEASTSYVGTPCGYKNNNQLRCRRNEQCTDTTLGLCTRAPLTRPVTPCNKGEWTQYDGNALHQGCTGDVVYDGVTPGLKWSYELNNPLTANSQNPPIVKGDYVYVTNGNTLTALWKNGTMKWTAAALNGNFKGSPAAARLKTPAMTEQVLIKRGSLTVSETGTQTYKPDETVAVNYGGQTHDAIISLLTDGSLAAFDAETGGQVCDLSMYNGKWTGKASCWNAQLTNGQYSPVIYGNNIYVATTDSIKVFGSDGKLTAELKTTGTPTMPTVAADGTVYAGTSMGYIYKMSGLTAAKEITFKSNCDADHPNYSGKVACEEVDGTRIICDKKSGEVAKCSWKEGANVECLCSVGTMDAKCQCSMLTGYFSSVTKSRLDGAPNIIAPPIFVSGPFADSEKDALVISDSSGAITRLDAGTLKVATNGNRWMQYATSSNDKYTNLNRPAATVDKDTASTYKFAILAKGNNQRLSYVPMDMSTMIWSTSALNQISPVSPMLISVMDPVRIAYFIDSDGYLKAMEMSPTGTDGAPDQGKAAPISIFKVATSNAAASMPVASGNTLYVAAENKLYAFVTDKQAPDYVNAKQQAGAAVVYGDKQGPNIMVGNQIQLCTEWKDNEAMKKARIVVTLDGTTNADETVSLSQKQEYACLNFVPTAEGTYTWYEEGTDVGGNTKRSKDNTFNAELDTSNVDKEAPTIILLEDSPRKFINTRGKEAVMPYDPLQAITYASDDMAIKVVMLYVCGSPSADGCDLAGGNMQDIINADNEFAPLNTPLNDGGASWNFKHSLVNFGSGGTASFWAKPQDFTDPNIVDKKGSTVIGWKQGNYISWMVVACDKASKYPPVGKTQKDRCTVLASNLFESGHGKFKVADNEAPVIQLLQGGRSVKPNGADAVKLEASVSDKVSIRDVTFTIGGDTVAFDKILSSGRLADLTTRTITAGYAAVDWSIDGAIKDAQGLQVPWFVTVRDKAGHETVSETKYFSVEDITAPEITGASIVQGTVREGDYIKVTVSATDNLALDTLQLYADGKACLGEGILKTNEAAKTATLTCLAPSPTAKQDFDWYAFANDSYNNKKTSATGSVHVIASCKAVSTAAPVIADATATADSILPSGATTITATVTDEVDSVTKCGGVGRVWVETQGEADAKNDIWRYAGEATVTPTNDGTVYSEDEKANKISKAAVTFDLTANKYREGIIFFPMAIKMSFENTRGIGMGGNSFGLPMQVIVAPGFENMFGAAVPYALPGTAIKWRLRATDTLNHESKMAAPGTVKIVDSEKPVEAEASQPMQTLTYTNKMNLSACWKDNGQLAKIIIETNETGAKVNHTYDVTADNAWTYKTACRNYTFYSPSSKPKSIIQWTAYAADSAGNAETSGGQTFRITGLPPKITEETATPSKPLQGQRVTIRVGATDDSGLRSAVFESNETGNFVENGRKQMSGTADTVEFLWDNPVVSAGTAVFWRVTVNDDEGMATVTDPTFVIQKDTVAPAVTNAKQSSDNPPQGTTVLLSAQVSDNSMLSRVMLETDEDGTVRNTTTMTATGTATNVSFQWQNKNLKSGTVVKWRIYAVDVGENTAASKQMYFTLAEAPKACPVCPPTLEWSKCTNGIQSRTAYTCGEATDYQCEANQEERSCTMSAADLAFSAIQKARSAVIGAAAAGSNTDAAQEALTEAEIAYANTDYATAQLKANEAIALLGPQQMQIGETGGDYTSLIGAGLLLVIIAIVAVFANKKGLFKEIAAKLSKKTAVEEPALKGNARTKR